MWVRHVPQQQTEPTLQNVINLRRRKVMPAWTNDEGENYADELDYRLWNPALESYQYISLDQAQGKVITMTEVSPYDGNVTIYVKNIEDCSS
jgi:hypothetical protein